MDPRYHRIHLGRRDSPTNPPQNDFIANSCFSGPQNWSKKVPGPKCRPGNPKSNPGLPNLASGMKKQKMRAEKPCRTLLSELQTEPYSASYGQKPFWRGLRGAVGCPGEAGPILDPIFRGNVRKSCSFTRFGSRSEIETGSAGNGARPSLQTLGSPRLRPG